jgi:hypothetical protein
MDTFIMAQTPQVPDPRIVWPQAHRPKSSVVFAQNAIDVAATPDKVWSLLVDCVAWPTWYKHCAEVSMLSGGPVLSSHSQFRFKTLGLYFEPVVEVFEPARMLVWSAKGPAGTGGAHAWLIEPTPSGCRVTTEEAQRGIILFIVRGRTRKALLTAHENWLQSLKALAETG